MPLAGFQKGSPPPERSFILNTIEEYRDERIPLEVVTHLIASSAVRFNHTYLEGQTLLQPFPRELTNLSDSGKGRDVRDPKRN